MRAGLHRGPPHLTLRFAGGIFKTSFALRGMELRTSHEAAARQLRTAWGTLLPLGPLHYQMVHAKPAARWQRLGSIVAAECYIFMR